MTESADKVCYHYLWFPKEIRTSWGIVWYERLRGISGPPHLQLGARHTSL